MIRLSDAALEADTDQMMTLIPEMPEIEAPLAKSLTKLARKFQFEQILDLIEPPINHDGL